MSLYVEADNHHLKTFEHYGAVFSQRTGNQLVGYCPFCGKENHLYVNVNNALWDCKACGANGNANKFLEKIWKEARKNSSVNELKQLETWKKIPKDILWKAGWVYYPFTIEFLLPVKNRKGTFIDLRRYHKRMDGVYSSPGCSSGLWGCERVNGAKVVWLCEGETDAISLQKVINDSDIDGEIVLSVPGANTFKKDWIRYFKQKTVRIVYDNDTAGKEGTEKVINLLKDSVENIYKLVWKAKKKGWDIRDEIRRLERKGKRPNQIYNYIRKSFEAVSRKRKNEKNVETQENSIEESSVISIGDKCWNWERTLTVFQKHIEMRTEMINLLWFIFAHAFSVEQGGNPLWSFIVGPSGCGKTMLLMSLAGSERCLFRSNLPPKSLVSGWMGKGGSDPSQLPKWNGKCTILKDFTEILSTNPTQKEELYGVLRGAYDGEVTKPFGNGITRHYTNLHFGLICGVTPAIHGDRQASMGERFLKYEVFRDVGWNSESEIRAALAGVGKESVAQEELREAAGRLLARNTSKESLPSWSEHSINKLVALSQLIGWLRATVEREIGWEQRIIHRPTHEMGTRLAKQLYKLGQNLAIVKKRKKVSGEEYKIVERCACDTARGWNLDIIGQIADNGGSILVDELRERLSLHWRTMEHSLDDMIELKIIKTYRGEKQKRNGKGQKPRYAKLMPAISKLWKEAKISFRMVKMIKKKRRVLIKRKK